MRLLHNFLMWIGGIVQKLIDKNAQGVYIPEEEMLKTKHEWEEAAKTKPNKGQ